MNNTLKKFRPGRASIRQTVTGCAFDVEEHRPGALKRAGQMVTSLWTELRREREKNKELRTHLKRAQEACIRYKTKIQWAETVTRENIERGRGPVQVGARSIEPVEGLVR